jgi:hypothetical protein
MSNGDILTESYGIAANTTYWFAPGTHYLGSSPYGQVAVQPGDVFVGAPGAVINGQGVNDSAFDDTSTDVTVEYLTVEDFVAVNGEYVVNHDGGADWTIAHNTIEDNTSAGSVQGPNFPGSAALGTGNGDVVEYNCLTANGEYGINASGTGVTVDYNEISYNGGADFPDQYGCGCSGGAKFWDATNFNVVGNYVHDNYNVGLWVDTDDAGFLFQDNYISGNWAEGITYEISYNADIVDNTFADNGWGIGSYSAGGFPYGDAIYVNGSGGDPNVASNYSGEFKITGNSFVNNWDGVLVYMNPNRLCGSADNSSSAFCTLDDPSVYTTTTCPEYDGSGSSPGSPLPSPSASPYDYFDYCQWKANNISVDDNIFDFNASQIASASAPLPQENLSLCYDGSNFLDTSADANPYWCGFNGMFSLYGSGSGGPAVAYTEADAMMGLANPANEPSFDNSWQGNTYNGNWGFQAWSQGAANQDGLQCTVDLADWQSIWGQD